MTTRLAYVGEALTITAHGVLLDLGRDTIEAAGHRRSLAYASITEVFVRHAAIGVGARLVVASPGTVLAKDYPEAGEAREARRIILHALNSRGIYTHAQLMRGQEDPATGDGPLQDRGRS